MQASEFLNAIEIPKRCSQDWSAMAGDERSRFCSHCEKHVFNLSALTSCEAEALVHEKEGHLCARLVCDSDGKVVTADRRPPSSRLRGPWQFSLRLLIGVVTAMASGIGAARMIPKEWLTPAKQLAPAAPMIELMGSVIPPASPPAAVNPMSVAPAPGGDSHRPGV